MEIRLVTSPAIMVGGPNNTAPLIITAARPTCPLQRQQVKRPASLAASAAFRAEIIVLEAASQRIRS